MKLFTCLLIRRTQKIKDTLFRLPLQGRRLTDNKEPIYWSEVDFGQLDEEVTKFGYTNPVRDRVPVIMMPDLTDCKLKPYVTYQAEKVFEPCVTSKDLFDAFYAPNIQAEVHNVPMETLPDDE